MMTQKPLMLKDFLELDSNSESCDGFRCVPRRAEDATVRRLLDKEHSVRLDRSRPKGAFTRLSAVINAVKIFSSSRQSGGPLHLTRSFSKRLRRSFWKRRGEAEEQEHEHERRLSVRDIVRLRSFEEVDGDERRSLYFPSPVVSSCSSLSAGDDDDDDDGCDFLLSSCDSSEFVGDNVAAGDNGGRRETKEDEREGTAQVMECGGCNSEEEKEQLSPVSVMDFPYQDEDEDDDDDNAEDDDSSPCFQQTLASIERTKHHLLQKIRRFESLAELDLDPIFASSEIDDPLESSNHVSSHEEEGKDENSDAETENTTAWDLLRQLKSQGQWCPQEISTEKLLLGFFTEGLSRSGDPRTRRETVEEALLKTAGEWISGGGDGGLGVAQIKETERSGGWTRYDEEEGEVASDVEDELMVWLLEELVLDIVSC